MNWFKRIFGLDIVDTIIHIVLTAVALSLVKYGLDWPPPAGYGGDFQGHRQWQLWRMLEQLVIGGSVLIFAVRRHHALKKLPPESSLPPGTTADDVYRMADRLSLSEARITELEDRLDFAERLLAERERQQFADPRGDD
jgi:hypothetical protein